MSSNVVLGMADSVVDRASRRSCLTHAFICCIEARVSTADVDCLNRQPSWFVYKDHYHVPPSLRLVALSAFVVADVNPAPW